jgi:hypothetical protein
VRDTSCACAWSFADVATCHQATRLTARTNKIGMMDVTALPVANQDNLRHALRNENI